jgi:hypothetical protein
MVERRVTAEWAGFPGKRKTQIAKVLVCRDDDACGARRYEAEEKRNAGEAQP